MKYDIFISYKSEYISIVKALSHTLENEGVRCWYAPRDLDSTRAGVDYDDAICSAINNSRAIILVLSNEALCSEWVKIEIGHAQVKKKLIIPYVVNEISSIHEDSGLLMRLRNKHWIDAYPNPERKFSTLLQNVKIVLNGVIDTEDSSDKERFEISDSYSEDDINLFDYEEGVALYEAKEYIDSVYALMAAAERGHQESKSLLCKMFYDFNKIQSERIPDDIWNGFNRLAKLGYGYANFIMHTKYYCLNDNLTSFEYLKKSLSDNVSRGFASLRIGIHYGWGLGVKPNHILDVHHYKKAIEYGCIQAYAYLGQVYIYGSEKNDVDLAKGVEYYQKGADCNDINAIKKLGDYYADYSDDNKAKSIEFYQMAIDLCDYSGYCKIGSYYAALESDVDEAEKFYKLAAIKEIPEAFGLLSKLYYHNRCDKKQAYIFARKGALLNSSSSLLLLGDLCKEDENHEEAWVNYYKNYETYGNGVEDIANLYFENNYKPEDVSIDDIIKMLDISARNRNEASVEYLIKIYSDDKYDKLNHNKANEYTKLGAEMGIDSCMFNLGKKLIEDEALGNPYLGYDWIVKSAKKSNNNAYVYLLDNIGNQYFSIDQVPDLYSSANYYSYVGVNSKNVADSLITTDVDAYKRYVDMVLTKTITNDPFENYNKILTQIIRNYDNKTLELNDDEIKNYMSKAKNRKAVFCQVRNILIKYESDFDRTNVESNYITSGKQFDEYYDYMKSSQYSNNIEASDALLTHLYSKTGIEALVGSIEGLDLQTISADYKYWQKDYSKDTYNIYNCYKVLSESFGLSSIEYFNNKFDKPTTYITSNTVNTILRDGVRFLISLSKSANNDILEAVTKIYSDEQVLNIAEKCTNVDVQNMLIAFVEIAIETDCIMQKNNKLYKAYINGEYSILANHINDYLKNLETAGYDHNITVITEDTIKDICQELPKVNIEVKESNNDESDEFDKLLNEFINTSINKAENKDDWE